MSLARRRLRTTPLQAACRAPRSTLHQYIMEGGRPHSTTLSMRLTSPLGLQWQRRAPCRLRGHLHTTTQGTTVHRHPSMTFITAPQGPQHHMYGVSITSKASSRSRATVKTRATPLPPNASHLTMDPTSAWTACRRIARVCRLSTKTRPARVPHLLLQCPPTRS